MATKTTNYNLIKPALSDDADIRVINGNMDVLDNQLKSISDKASNTANNTYTDITVSSDYTWKFTKGSGANVSHDTIKKATTATALSGTASTYKPNGNSAKYSQLEYWFGSMPYKGSVNNTIDAGVLKVNHFGASAWNAGLVINNSSANRPYMAYQNGTAGDWSVYKDLAWYDDTTNKLPLAGGTMTGAIKTTDNIYKSSNSGVLVLSGSTDATHGGRINLSGEKQTDAGLVKITADNGTASNVFEVSTAGAGSQYKFNGLTTYMNSNDDYFCFGDNSAYFKYSKNKILSTNASSYVFNGIPINMNSSDDYFRFGDNNAYFRFGKNKSLSTNATTYNLNGIDVYANTATDILTVGGSNKPKLAFNAQGDLRIDKYGDSIFRLVQTRFDYSGNWGDMWVYSTNDLLLQGGIATVNDTATNITLLKPYVDKNSYILYVSDGESSTSGLPDYMPVGERVSGTTIALNYLKNRRVAWFAIGGRPQ